MTLHWHDEAENEYVAAAVYYERQVEGLGERYIAGMEAAVAKMLSAPLRPRSFEGIFRRIRLERFPYFLIYQVVDEDVRILAVMHASRRPGYWRNRMV